MALGRGDRHRVGAWQARWLCCGPLPCPLILLRVCITALSILRVVIGGETKWQAAETVPLAVGRDPVRYFVGWGRGAAFG